MSTTEKNKQSTAKKRNQIHRNETNSNLQKRFQITANKNKTTTTMKKKMIDCSSEWQELNQGSRQITATQRSCT